MFKSNKRENVRGFSLIRSVCVCVRLPIPSPNLYSPVRNIFELIRKGTNTERVRKKSRKWKTNHHHHHRIPFSCIFYNFYLGFDAGHIKWIISISSLHGKFTQFSISLSMFAVCTVRCCFFCFGMMLVVVVVIVIHSTTRLSDRLQFHRTDLPICVINLIHIPPLVHSLMFTRTYNGNVHPTRPHSFIHTMLIVFRSSFSHPLAIELKCLH